MTTSADAASRIRAALQEGLRNVQERGGSVNEAVTRAVLIDRVLDELGYPVFNRTPEDGDRNDRPDYTCYPQAVARNPGKAALIVEAKALGVDFDKSPGQLFAAAPDQQIQRYLKQHRASGAHTRGVLTDGLRWRIYRRTASPTAPDIDDPEAFDFRPVAEPGAALSPLESAPAAEQLAEFIRLLAPGLLPVERPAASSVDYADALFDAIIQNSEPASIVRRMLDEDKAALVTRQESPLELTGIRQYLHNEGWGDYAYAQGAMLKSEQAPLPGDPAWAGNRVVVAAVQFRHDKLPHLPRPYAAMCARIFAETGPAKAALVFAYIAAPDGGLQARVIVSAAGQVNMTVPFDPGLPSPSARAAIGQLLPLLRQTDPIASPDRLLAPLAAAPLRQQFYREIDQWTRRIQRGRNAVMRRAVLRHLIRVMFVWILKESNRIPPQLFERGFIREHLPDLNAYHRTALRFLFHQRLNVDQSSRPPHPVEAIHQAMEDAPFLNGSLFREDTDSDPELDLPAAAYWNSDDQRPGLFTILSRYHWTMDEHRPGESEQTLDPELLSNLFERLIAPTQQGGEAPLRQPQGTYYTPADVSDEMVKDALTAAVKDHAGPLAETQLLALFGQPEPDLPDIPAADLERLAARLRELRIFDPAVGSGEFLLSMLLAVRRALQRLYQRLYGEQHDGSDYSAEAIIRRQLAGQDINPLAVQIARLRLYIAIIAARHAAAPGAAPAESQQPLPNLEAIIVCADTLATVADPQWRTAQLDQSDPAVGAAVQAIIANRREWFAAYAEDTKDQVLRQDKRLRGDLELLLQSYGALASPELKRLTRKEMDLMAQEPHHTDARLLFPQGGFDIVIGNPPYEALSKSLSATARKRLTTDKRYQTVGGGDLYNLFCETALALAKPDGGVVTLIVPHSISFGRAQRNTRMLFESKCEYINLRHQANRPDSTFNASPTVRNQENRQQTTIITCRLGDAKETNIASTGWQRWLAQDRSEFLHQRNYLGIPSISRNTVDPSISLQWPRVPTESVRAMVEAIIEQKNKIGSYETADGPILALPKVAYLFMPTTPLDPRATKDQTPFRVASADEERLIMAALNGHVAYAWWQVFGDNFHVLKRHLTEMTIPNAWVENPGPAIELGQRLIEAIPECTRVTNRMHGVQRDADFYQKPGLIEELDRLHLGALGLPAEPLLGQLRIMRSSSSWNYGAA